MLFHGFGFKKKDPRVRSRMPGTSGRQDVRLATAVRGEWRIAAEGRGYGPFARGTITDISRTGASLILKHEFELGTQVELKLSLNSHSQPLVLFADVKRTVPVEGSRTILHGLQFKALVPDDEKAIMDYINRRQAERRERGLV